MRWIALLLLLVAVPHAHAEDDRAQTSGFAVGGGVGFENAGIGAHALYYLQTRDERWRLAPHIGVGYFGKVAVSGGVMALFGRRHRLVLDLMVSPAAAQGGTNQPTYVEYALSILAGYEWMSEHGWAFRTTVGGGVGVRHADWIYLALNPISISYKFW